MIEIIPNWHPIFVHFTVALWSLAVGFHIFYSFMPEGKFRQHFYILANWNLWLGTGFGIITVITGWFAYNSVVHDASSHVVMTDHRNWAFITLGLFIVLTGWSLWCERKQRQLSKLFLVVLIIGGILLASTAWRGAEMVYRYGLGVMSLPKPETDDHEHEENTNNNPLVRDEISVPGKRLLKNSTHEDKDDHNHTH